MREKLYILGAEAATPLGGLEELWRLWIENAPRGVTQEARPEEWRRETDRVVSRIVRGLGAEDRASTGLILATTKGDIDRQVEWMRASEIEPSKIENRKSKIALPTLGSEAGRLAESARIGGPVHAVSTACTSGITGLVDAAVMLHGGEAQRIIVVGADQATSFVHDGFTALKALSATTCRPFDKGRDGLRVNSAAAALLVGTSPDEERGATLSAVISGYGVSMDATHMTAPDAEGKGLMRAIRGALEMAKLEPEDINVVVAHGTGTRYNDAMEAVAIRGVFLGNGAKGPAVTAVKGLVGHTLGASGVVETALAAMILREQIVPRVHGLEEAEFAGIDFVMKARRMRVRHVLKMAAGFGGMNAAVILSGEEDGGGAPSVGRWLHEDVDD